MAQLVIMANAKGSNSDSRKNWEQFDIVDVFEDDERLGTEVSYTEHVAHHGNDANWEGTFYVVAFNGLSKADALIYAQPHIVPAIQGEPEFDSPDEADRVVNRGLRRFSLDLPNPVINDLKSNWVVQKDWPNGSGWLRNKGV